MFFILKNCAKPRFLILLLVLIILFLLVGKETFKFSRGPVTCREVLISVIVPFYSEIKDIPEIIENVKSQSKFTELELIIVNDASKESDAYRRAFEVLHRDNAGYDTSDKSVVHWLEPGAAHISGEKCGGRIYFASVEENRGLGNARNYGISLAAGMWVISLDSDDRIDSNFFSKIGKKLKGVGKTWDNPHPFNVISMGMRTQSGSRLSWQPLDISKNDVKLQNTFHCSALVLRAVFDVVQYKTELFVGWEDWDFWVNFHRQIGIQALYVQEALFIYTLKSVATMKSFCADYQNLCGQVFRLFNPESYTHSDVLTAIHYLLSKDVSSARNDNKEEAMVLKLVQHGSWKQLERSLPKVNALVMLALVNIARGDNTTAADLVMKALHTTNEKEDCDRIPMIHHLLELLDIRIPLNSIARCGATDHCAAVLTTVKDYLLTNTYQGRNSFDGQLFHQAISLEPHNIGWLKLFLHSISSIIYHHPESLVVLHAFNVEKIKDYISHLKSEFHHNILVVPLCTSYYANLHGFYGSFNKFQKMALGRPYYYSHVTDLFRLLVLYTFGGRYLDTDIVLRRPLSSEMSLFALSIQTEKKGYFFGHPMLNGAFLAAPPSSPFLRALILQIPDIYDPAVWAVIGPDILTNALARQSLPEVSQYPKVLPANTFYKYSWFAKDVKEFSQQEVSQELYDQEMVTGVYGYHFWSKVIFKSGHEEASFAKNSMAYRVLKDTCFTKSENFCLVH